MTIAVTQVMASGAGGGAQVHVQNLVERLDRARFDIEVISLADGPAVRRLRAIGVTVHVIDEPDDDAALARVVELLCARPPDIVHNHMYRAEVVGTRAAIELGPAGLPRPYVIGTVHSSRVRSASDRELLRALTPQMDRLIAVSRAIVAKLEREGRTGVPRRAHLQRRRPHALRRTPRRAARCPRNTASRRARRWSASSRGWSRRRATQTLLEAWPLVLAAVPEARLLIIGEGSQRPSRSRRRRRRWTCSAGRARPITASARATPDRARRSSSPACATTSRP